MTKPNLRLVGSSEPAQDELAMSKKRDQQAAVMMEMFHSTIMFWFMLFNPLSYVIQPDTKQG